MTFESGERRAAELLVNVELPTPFDISEFCRLVGTYRNREIVLVRQDSGNMGEAVGLLIGRERLDEIHYEADTSGYHQQAIILHEVGHLMCDPITDDGAAVDFPLELLGGDWDPQVVRRLKQRRRYHNDQERAAEGFATAVLERVGRQPQHTRGSGPSSTSPPEQQRLTAMFVE